MSPYVPSSLSQLLYDPPGQLACISKLHYHNVRFKGLLLLREIKRGINLSRRCLAPTTAPAHWADFCKTSHFTKLLYIYFLRHVALTCLKIVRLCQRINSLVKVALMDPKHNKGYRTERQNIGQAFNQKQDRRYSDPKARNGSKTKRLKFVEFQKFLKKISLKKISGK